MTMNTRSFYPGVFSAALLALAFVTSATAALPQFVKGEPVTSLAPLVEAASPAVVNIRVTLSAVSSACLMVAVDLAKSQAPDPG